MLSWGIFQNIQSTIIIVIVIINLNLNLSISFFNWSYDVPAIVCRRELKSYQITYDQSWIGGLKIDIISKWALVSLRT